jgi:hypothetical protein
MASPFQRYQSGIEASTGNLVAASGKMAEMTANALGNLGKDIGEGIAKYNENLANSERADIKLKGLGQAVQDKIKLAQSDPEIAQSGLLDILLAQAQAIKEAPKKGLNARLQIIHEGETALSQWGDRLKEWSFYRGREMERVTNEGLKQYSGVKTVTDPRFAAEGEFKFNPNKSLQDNKTDVLAKLALLRKANPNLQGTDEDFLANWLSGAERSASKADPRVIPAAVTSSLLEQIAAEKRLIKSNAEAQKTEPAISEAITDWYPVKKSSSASDYFKVMAPATDVLKPKEPAPSATPPTPQPVDPKVAEAESVKRRAQEELVKVEGLIKKAEDDIKNERDIPVAWYDKASFALEEGLLDAVNVKGLKELAQMYMSQGRFKELTPDNARMLIREVSNDSMGGMAILGSIVVPNFARELSKEEIRNIEGAFADWRSRDRAKRIGKTGDAEFYKQELEKRRDFLKNQLLTGRSAPRPSDVVQAKQEKAKAEAPVVPELPVSEFVLGTVTEEKPLSVTERQQQVADFVTSRMGAIDPSDPERKRRLPVTGFDKFYKSLIPETEIREFTTDSGVRLMLLNGKWEQIKPTAMPTLQDVRKESVGVYGKQDAQGRLVPTEFAAGTGVYVGGVFRGGDASAEKYHDEMLKLVDARRGVRELQRINDLVGESLMPAEQGRAAVEKMNLAAMLREDIVGVGTVSNYEQTLINKVVIDGVDFFSLEAKDRAILIALAERVDRRIQNLSSSRGLTVVIKDTTSGNKYQGLREQYLKEKGIL